MSRELPSFLRRRPRAGTTSAGWAGARPGHNGTASAAAEVDNGALRAQRDRLLERFTIMQADLGGAFYEMAIRDHVRLDVLTRRAAELQRVDTELQEVERRLELERSDAAGICPSCSAPYGHGVRFCSQCGGALGPVQAVP
jgi:hypothetical protein